MSFLNASLMLAMAAAAVPIALHLISRREPRRVVFPAVRFLTQRHESNRSRLRIRRWWLLALRIAALVALALTLAHPVVHREVSVVWVSIGLVALLGVGLLAMASVAAVRQGIGSTAKGLLAASIAALLVAVGWGGYTIASGPSPSIDRAAPVALAIVLDNSPTSGWRSSDDDRMERMRELATWMITRVPASSRIAILDRSTVPAAFSLDIAGAISKVESLQPLQVASPIASRIDAAIRLVRTSELENRQVFVVSDLTETSWREEARITDLAGTLTTDPPMALTVFDLGEFDGVNRSLSIPRIVDITPARGVSTSVIADVQVTAFRKSDEIGATAETARAGEPAGEVSVTAELQLYGSDPGLPVVRDGRVERPSLRRVDRTSLRVRPGATGEVLLTVPPLAVGRHHAVLRLAGEDPFSLDDRRYFTLQVLPSSPLLMVGDRRDDAGVLAAAIAAPFEVGDPQAEFAVERIGYADLPAVILDEFQGVMLLDPPASALADRSLETFVRAGGRLMVCLGPSWGEGSPVPAGGASDDRLIPAPIRRWRPLDPGTFLEILRRDHPLLRPFTDGAQPPRWSDYRVFQYWQVEAGERDQVLARYGGSEHPAVLQRSFGAGNVLLLTTPLPALAPETRGWNDFFSASEPWPAFVLVRQLAEQLSGRGELAADTRVGQPHLARLSSSSQETSRPPGNSTPGNSTPETSVSGTSAPRTSVSGTSAPGDAEAAGDRVSQTPSRIQLFPPGERMPVPLTVSDGDSSQVLIRDVDRAGTYWIRGVNLSGGFSANLPEESTSLQRIDPSNLDLWFGPEGYRIARSRDEVELAETRGSASVSLQSPMMLLALVAFILEQILGNRFYRSGGAAASLRKQVAA